MINNQDNSKLARWVCLYEAVNIIADKAEKLGHKTDCLKPIPIGKYIAERYPSVLKDIEYENKHINNSLHKHHH